MAPVARSLVCSLIRYARRSPILQLSFGDPVTSQPIVQARSNNRDEYRISVLTSIQRRATFDSYLIYSEYRRMPFNSNFSLASLSPRACREKDRLLVKKQNVANAVVKINLFLLPLLPLLCEILSVFSSSSVSSSFTFFSSLSPLHYLSHSSPPLSLFLPTTPSPLWRFVSLSLFLGLLLIMHAYTPLIVQVVYAVSTISRFESRGSFENTTAAEL